MASRFDPNAVLIGAGPPSAGYFALAAIPARYALERRDWQEAEQLAVRETPFPFTDAITWFARGLGAARLGHTPAANEASTALKLIQERLLRAAGPLSPARELMGEMLLVMNEPSRALEEFEATLKKEPGRFNSLYGAAHAAQLSGSCDTSQKYFRELLRICAHSDKPARSELKEAEQSNLRK
jgi:hypothetical protein